MIFSVSLRFAIMRIFMINIKATSVTLNGSYVLLIKEQLSFQLKKLWYLKF